MLKNYITLAIRNILRHKLHTFINIGGLSIGLAVVIVINLFVIQELRTDKFHENLEQIYRVAAKEFNGTFSLPPTFTDSISEKIPEITRAVRTLPQGNKALGYNGNMYFENIIFVDPSFLDIFSFQVIAGDISNSLTLPSTVVLTESVAKKVFGNENPIEQIVTYDLVNQLTVKAIIKDVPKNSSIQFSAMVSMSSIPKFQGREALLNSGDFSFPTYLLLGKNQNPKTVEQKLSKDGYYKLYPFKEAYFYSNHNDSLKHGNMMLVKTLIAIGLLILIIAIINYVNLSTAKSVMRITEIGIRKVFGAFRKQLITQLLAESFVITLIAFVLSLFLSKAIIPKLNEISGVEIAFADISNPLNWIIFLIALIILTLLSGIYPAYFTSSSNPSGMIKRQFSKGSKAASFRKFLISFQFFISITLIICTLTIFRQMDFIKNKELGFNKDNIVNVPLTQNVINRFDVFKQNLSQIPDVKDVVLSFNTPVNIGTQMSRSLTYKGKKLDLECYVMIVQPGYIEAMDFKIVKGRSFSKDLKSDLENFILNETAVKSLDIDNPLDLEFGSSLPGKGKVVGIVKDFNFRSLYEPVKPLAFCYLNDWCKLASIKIGSQNTKPVINTIKQIWDELSPGYPFSYTILDQEIDNQYLIEKRLEKLFGYFSIFAIFIACLGLFGLSVFETQQRTKEIGILKVNGASIINVMFKLSVNFTKWVIIGFLIACPVAWYVTRLWLQLFAYKIQPGISIFIISGLFSLLIALITVSCQSWRASGKNPVEALRYE